jgi:formate-dependent phosphoribosylglycinamide formyltransferase (GAR transformylase)
VVGYGFAKTTEECVKVANEIGYPVALKIVSPDILHKTDVGSIKLNVDGDESIIRAYGKMMADINKREPDARILGVKHLVYIDGTFVDVDTRDAKEVFSLTDGYDDITPTLLTETVLADILKGKKEDYGEKN